jgi:hypothetical protein
MMAMRKLIVQQWVTVDNIAAEEDGGLSFMSREPFSETTNTAFKASAMGFIDSIDTMMLVDVRPGQGLLAVRRRAGRVRRKAQQPHQARRLVEPG